MLNLLTFEIVTTDRFLAWKSQEYTGADDQL